MWAAASAPSKQQANGELNIKGLLRHVGLPSQVLTSCELVLAEARRLELPAGPRPALVPTWQAQPGAGPAL